MQKQENKIRGFVLAFLMIAAFLPGLSIPVKAETGKIGTANYSLENGVLTISGGSFTSQDFWTLTKQSDLMQPNRTIKAVSFKNAHLTDTGKELFYIFYALESADLSGLDISGVTDLGGLFYACTSLKKVVLGGSFNTSNVTNMGGMFTDCTSLNSIDVRSINTSSATNMLGMFRSCKSLTSIDVSGFDTSHVTNMQEMFSNCSNLTELDLTSFDMSGKPSAVSMFSNCSLLKTIYASDWSSFIQEDGGMFNNCTNLVGGAGTKFSTGYTGKDYARVDGGSAAPGYFSNKQKVSYTAPKAKTGLVENGSAQELITAGSATGGTMQYALGNQNAATGTYSSTIPAATDAGTYYVWYMVKGDTSHLDSGPAYVTVTIAKKPEPAQEKPENKQPEKKAASEKKKTSTKKTEKKADVSTQLNMKLRLSWKGSNVVFKWGKVSGADSYEIHMVYCGDKPIKKVRTVRNVNRVVFKKLDGKKLNQRRCVKGYVVAYRNGTKIGRSLVCHSAGKKSVFTNAKKIKTSKKTYKLKVGKTAKLKAKTVKRRSGKRLLGNDHTARLRYASSDTSVATVSKGGKIKAVGTGKCSVWVYAQNGISRKVTVIVK